MKTPTTTKQTFKTNLKNISHLIAKTLKIYFGKN
jgi:hypothetical protein